jgi:hypothetical protein
MPIEVMLSGIAMSFCQASRAASTIVLAEAETAKPPSVIVCSSKPERDASFRKALCGPLMPMARRRDHKLSPISSG